LSLIS